MKKKQRPSTTGASRIYGRALLSFPPSLLSLSLLLGTAHPAQCSEKAKPTREDLGVTLYSVVTDASKEISFSLSLSLAPLRMETSRHFFHHGLIQCLLTCTPHFPLTSYIRRYIPHTPSYNVSTIFLRISPSFKRRVFFERSGASMEVRRFVSHLDFALYSVVGIARSKKFRNVRKAQVLLYVFIRIYICALMRVGVKMLTNVLVHRANQFSLFHANKTRGASCFVYARFALVIRSHSSTCPYCTQKNTDDVRMNRIRFRDVEMNIEENWHKLTCLTITTPHRYRANNKKKKKKEDEQRLHEYTHRVKFASDVTYCCNFSSSSSFPPSSPLPPILQISFPEASGLRL